MTIQHRVNAQQAPKVIGSGLIALDVLLSPGSAAGYRAVGGSAGNVLAILAYLGWTSFPVATLGQDAAAVFIEREFRELGAATDFLVGDVSKGTPVVYQWNDESQASPKYSFRCPMCGRKRGFNAAGDQDLVDSVIANVQGRAVYFFDRATKSTAALAEHFRSNRGIVIFEPSEADGTDEFSRCVRASHVLKYSNDRIHSLTSEDLSSAFVEVQTLGREGLRYRTPRLSDDWIKLTAIETPHVADTSGAGDWCTAGALYWFLRNGQKDAGSRVSAQEVGTALRFGQALATLNCMYVGARGISRMWSATSLLRAAEKMTAPSSKEGEEVAATLSEFLSRHDQESRPSASHLCCEALSF